MRVAVELTEMELIENWLNGCHCPAEGEWRNGERVITAIHILLDCKIHQLPQETSGEHFFGKLEDDPYAISPDEVPPPDLPDPSHHVFFEDEAAVGRIKAAGDRAWDQHHDHKAQRSSKPVPSWGPSVRELVTICLSCVVLIVVVAGFVLWRL